MKVFKDTSVEAFLQEASELLYQDEVTHSLMIGLCEGMAKVPPKIPPNLIRVVSNGKTVATATQTPPMNLVLSYANQEMLENIADFVLQNKDISIPGVVGPVKESETFAKIWNRLTGTTYTLGMSQKIYKIEKVQFPKNVSGTFHTATAEDEGLVAKWIMAFAQESLPKSDQRSEAQWKELAQRMIKNQTAHLWLDNNQPVSMALASRPTRNGISISGVYTPHESRKKGYASAVVANISQKMLDSGKKFCVLYTDLSNPTSNKIYQNIGYVEVSDSKHFILG